jgi:hypothetical protein
VSDAIYTFPTIGLAILLEEVCRPILGLYKSLTDTRMLKLGLRPRYSLKIARKLASRMQILAAVAATEGKFLEIFKIKGRPIQASIN